MALVFNRSHSDPLSDVSKEIISFQEGGVVIKPVTKEEHRLGLVVLGSEDSGAKGHSTDGGRREKEMSSLLSRLD